jgi:hypothetical protein
MSHLKARFRDQMRILSKQRLLTGLVVGMAFVPSLISPAAARPRVIIRLGDSVRQPAPSTYIYGSPIPAPVPVNPVTGHVQRYDRDAYGRPSRRDYSNYGFYRRDRGIYDDRRGIYRGRIEDSVLVNPTIVDSEIEDSVLINPTIIDQNRRYYRVHRRYLR